MTYFDALILSIIEGVTEFLPISSTGHMILTTKLLGIETTEFVKTFEISIQLGAILAIVFLYWKQYSLNKTVIAKIMTAFLPTAIIGLLMYKVVKSLLGSSEVTLATLFFGGIALIVLELLYKEKDHHAATIEAISYKNAFLIGLCQSISVIPGVSRAAATILGALFLGTKRKAAVEFSFLLAVPTMAAATGLDLLKANFAFSMNEWSLLGVGFLGAFITALIAVKWFLTFIKTHSFIPFGIYRIILAIVFFFFIIE